MKTHLQNAVANSFANLQTKRCKKCGVTKALSEFDKNPHSNQGVVNGCKKCRAYCQREYYKANADKIKPKKYNNRVKELLIQNHDKIKKRALKYRGEAIKELKDIYLKELLRHKGLTNEDIEKYPQLIELQKQIIKTKRLCKTSKN